LQSFLGVSAEDAAESGAIPIAEVAELALREGNARILCTGFTAGLHVVLALSSARY